jgi:endo-1,4-beta-D-glucanase Y
VPKKKVLKNISKKLANDYKKALKTTGLTQLQAYKWFFDKNERRFPFYDLKSYDSFNAKNLPFTVFKVDRANAL